MKYLVLVADGMGDRPIESLGKRTPLEVARIPNINELSRQGLLGLVQTTPDGMAPGSEVTHLALLGFDPKQLSISRAPLEAASLGISLNPADVAFRCNLVTFCQGAAPAGSPKAYQFGKIGPGIVLEDYSAGHISTDQARELIHDLNEQLGTEAIQFYPGLSYRHLMIWIGGKARIRCTPPQDMAGQRIVDHFPKGEGDSILKELLKAATEILSLHPINEERIREGLRPANGIWVWGQGKSFNLPSFSKKYGLKGAVVAAVEMVKGLGAAVGLEVVEVPGATGYVDTNYLGKARAALKALERQDLALLHVEAPDEASHEGNLEAKVKAIEDFDREVVGTIRQELDHYSELRLLMLCDHCTPVLLRCHTPDPVPFVIFEKSGNNRIKASGMDYHEKNAKQSGSFFNGGQQLMDYFLKH